LRVLLVGLCTLVLLVQAAAATSAGTDAKAAPASTYASKARTSHVQLTLDQQLRRKLAAVRRYRGALHFFATHRELFSSHADGSRAAHERATAKQRLRSAERAVARLRAAIARRDARRLAGMPPRTAICRVFGGYCREAVNVAWCESRLSTTAQNGQYLGLFQMGESERRIFGHGPTAHAQALAAHRYFVASGRDWSPWGCRWAAS
jgi:hypothetical protein